jgi:hypothetical protein
MARLCSYKGERGDMKAGVFHRWADSYEYGQGDEKIPCTVGLVEDMDSGKTFFVDPGDLVFHPRPKPLTPEHDDEAQALLERLIECER